MAKGKRVDKTTISVLTPMLEWLARLPLAAKIGGGAGLALIIALIIGVSIWKREVVLPPVIEPPEILLPSEGPGDTLAPPEGDDPLPVISSPPNPTSAVMPTAEPQDVIYRVLLAVLDNGNNLTDAMIVANINCTKVTIDLVNIPRDTYIESAARSSKRINAAYGKNADSERLMEELKSILGFAPDYYIVGSLSCIEELVDLVGGVTFNIPENMDYDDPDQSLHIHFKKGSTRLNGKDAVKVLRYRGYSSADFGRMATQQAFIKAYLKKALSIDNLLSLPRLPTIVEKNVKSNLDWGEMLALALAMKSIDMDTGMTMYTLPVTDYTADSHAYQRVLKDEAATMVQEVFGQ